MIVKNQNDILNILKIQMKNKGVTQGDISRQLDIARPQVSKALSGKNAMQLDTLFNYLQACGLSLDINIVDNNLLSNNINKQDHSKDK